MIKYIVLACISIILVLGAFTTSEITSDNYFGLMTVVEYLEKQGVDFSTKKPDYTIKGVSAELGEQIFHQGSGEYNGYKSKKQSRFFVCSSCHNVEKEDPDLSINDPQARLLYTNENGLPFLQGTTMYGAVNRSTYYNGDYDQKYGEMVADARDDIRGAIQLCATECSQGRALKDYELESMLAYLWSLELKMSDLSFSEQEREIVLNDTNANHEESVQIVEQKYLHASGATFVPPPPNRIKGNGLEGNVENGQLIYKNSCLHCHYQSRYSYLHLDETDMSLKYLSKKIGTYHPHSIYQVVRWGIGSHYMNEAYMPNYTLEKLSEQQLADLVAYIRQH